MMTIRTMMTTKLMTMIGEGKDRVLATRLLTRVRLVNTSALQSLKLQLIGMS